MLTNNKIHTSSLFFTSHFTLCFLSLKSNSINLALKNTNSPIFTILSMRKKMVFLCFSEYFFMTLFAGSIQLLFSKKKYKMVKWRKSSYTISPRNEMQRFLTIISLTYRQLLFSQHSNRLLITWYTIIIRGFFPHYLLMKWPSDWNKN